MERVYNFGAGPATLPTDILLQARDELLDWQQSGMSVMEVSHRGGEFKQVMAAAQADLRELLNIPNNYKVLFLTAPGRSQFAMIPQNCLGSKTTANYLVTGIWSDLAIAEAQRYCQPKLVASTKPDNYTHLPDAATWDVDPNGAYLYFTSNETINGVEFPVEPEVAGMPLVADMTSNLLSRPIDINKYGLIFAGAQKNIGPAGLTVVIVRDDFVQPVLDNTPSINSYITQDENDSMLYTPNSFAIYMAGLMFKWLLQQGGVAAIAKQNQIKAEKLYAFIDGHDFYNNPIAADARSRMNVVFTLAKPELDTEFVKQATAAGLSQLKGHRMVGGMRASIYNAMSEAGIDALINFMRDFADKNK